MPATRVTTALRSFGAASSSQPRIRLLHAFPSSNPKLLGFYIHISRGATHQHLTAAVTIDARQMRFQSTSEDVTSELRKSKRSQRPPISRLLLKAFRDSFSNLFRAFRGENFREIFRRHPEELVLALVTLIVMAGIVAYVIRLYFTYFYSEQFTRLPDPVAKSMRRALYYSNYAPDHKLALKYYKLALEQCVECGVDPFSDEFMGIRIQLAAWLEKIQLHKHAIDALESLLSECKLWVEKMEQATRDGTLPQIQSSLSPASDGLKATPGDSDGSLAATPKETVWGKRNRVLRRAIGISVKLGQLYSDEHVLESDLAHERLTWAVESGLKELQRRSVEGVKEGEGEWMNGEEIGASLEALGNSFLAKNQSDLAVPLLFQAFHLCQDPCHNAVIMNNLAASFAQHPIQGSGETTLIDNLPTTSSGAAARSLDQGGPNSSAAVDAIKIRTTYLDFAKNWATNANKLASETNGDRRTAECDEACAVSLCNLGDIANFLGDAAEARRRFEQCVDMSRKLGFEAGVRRAEAGLRSL